MHLKFGYFVLYTPIYRLTERKKPFRCTKLSMRNGRCEQRLCARASRARQSTLVILVANNVQILRWPALHQMCAAIPQQYTHRHILLMSTRFLAVDATPVRMYKVLNFDLILQLLFSGCPC